MHVLEQLLGWTSHASQSKHSTQIFCAKYINSIGSVMSQILFVYVNNIGKTVFSLNESKFNEKYFLWTDLNDVIMHELLLQLIYDFHPLK